jgi:hypothetical protein
MSVDIKALLYSVPYLMYMLINFLFCSVELDCKLTILEYLYRFETEF